jgi:hypothetical protein
VTMSAPVIVRVTVPPPGGQFGEPAGPGLVPWTVAEKVPIPLVSFGGTSWKPVSLALACVAASSALP